MFADDMLAIAEDLINTYGDDAYLVEVIPGVYDPQTGTKNDTYLSSPIKLVQEDLNSLKFTGEDAPRMELIINSSIKFSFVTDKDVRENMFVLYNNKKFEITSAKPITTQNTTVLWEVFAKTIQR